VEAEIVLHVGGGPNRDVHAALDFDRHRYKQAIGNVPYFQNNLQKTNGVLLTSLSAPQIGPLGRNPYVMFNLQCYFPEKVR